MVTFGEIEPAPPRRPRGWVILAVVGLVGTSMFALTQLTRPSSADAVATTTPTTFPRPTNPTQPTIQIQGYQPEWIPIRRFSRPIRTIAGHRVGDREYIYLQTSLLEVAVYEVADHGLILLGLIPGAATITNAQQRGDGLYLFGHDQTGRPSVWHSPDGINWVQRTLPVVGVGDEVQQGVATDDLIVVVGSSVRAYSTYEIVHAAATRLWGPVVSWAQWGYDLDDGSGDDGDGDPILDVFGPLGLHLFRTPLSELGLDPGLFGQGSTGSDPKLVWTSVDGADWERHVIEFQNGNSLFVGPDGRVWMDAWNRNAPGAAMMATSDGVTWERVSENQSFDALIAWGERYLRLSQQNSTVLSASSDAQNWGPNLIADVIQPDQAGIYSVAASNSHIALTALGANSRSSWGRSVDSELAVGDATVTVNDTDVIISRPGHPDLTYPRHEEIEPSPFLLNWDSITFLDPDGEEVVSLTVNQLDGLEPSGGVWIWGDNSSYFLYSRDGATWNVQSLGEAIGETGMAQVVLIGDLAVLATWGGRPDTATLWITRLPGG